MNSKAVLVLAIAAVLPVLVHAKSLETVVAALSVPVGSQDSAAAKWSAIAKLPGIKWRDKDVRARGRDYVRSGSLPVGKLGTASITWAGLPDVALTADVRTEAHLSPPGYEESLKGQFSATAKLRRIRGGCKVAPLTQSAVFEVTLPGKQPMYLHVNTDPAWNGGKTTVQVSAVEEGAWSC